MSVSVSLSPAKQKIITLQKDEGCFSGTPSFLCLAKDGNYWFHFSGNLDEQNGKLPTKAPSENIQLEPGYFIMPVQKSRHLAPLATAVKTGRSQRLQRVSAQIITWKLDTLYSEVVSFSAFGSDIKYIQMQSSAWMSELVLLMELVCAVHVRLVGDDVRMAACLHFAPAMEQEHAQGGPHNPDRWEKNKRTL